MVGRFLDRLRPQVVALMELEVWPNLAQECQRRGIPLVVINGRLSDSSFGTYRWARRWITPMFEGLTAVAAQTESYAERFRELGTPPERVTVTDNMKWDTVTLSDDVEGSSELSAAMGIDTTRPLVVAGSTGPGEEERLIRERPPGVQLMLVPRKPERFEEVARLAPGMARRSQRPDGFSEGAGNGLSDLFLLDTMGELSKAYALADVAVVGRSLVPLGGSDPIDPVALGKPTLIGPRHENFREVVSALEEGGGIRVTDRPMEVVAELLASPDQGRAMAQAGREVIRSRQGATQRHERLLLNLLAGEGNSSGGMRGGVSGPASNRGQHQPRRVRNVLFALLALYVMGGYLSTAFTRIDASEAADPGSALPTPQRTLVSGVFSVHTGRSHDAQGTRNQVAAAAASAGLDFVVIGDHPPGDRRPDWQPWDPEYFDGVLVDGGMELRGPRVGKVLAMGVDSTFRRWEDDLGSFTGFLNRRGMASMVVHGRGPRESERWDHTSVEGLDGWEVLDVSESSRARLRGPWAPYHLLTALLGYPLGLADEALLHLMREGFDTPTVAAYDSLRTRGPLTATAGLNVHPKVKLGPVLVPSYGPFFRTLVSHLCIEGPLPRDPALAQETLGRGIKRGELFISLGHAEDARGFRLQAIADDGQGAPMGADVPIRPGMVFRGGFEEGGSWKVVYRIIRDGQEVEWVLGPELEWRPDRPAVYRVEVYRYRARTGDVFFGLKPWIFANPFRLLGEEVVLP
jgi:3-deoxy-D-manno-octulosonic-acid transferase